MICPVLGRVSGDFNQKDTVLDLVVLMCGPNTPRLNQHTVFTGPWLAPIPYWLLPPTWTRP